MKSVYPSNLFILLVSFIHYPWKWKWLWVRFIRESRNSKKSRDSHLIGRRWVQWDGMRWVRWNENERSWLLMSRVHHLQIIAFLFTLFKLNKIKTKKSGKNINEKWKTLKFLFGVCLGDYKNGGCSRWK